MRCLWGQTPVLELGYQPFMRNAGDILAATGTQIPQYHSAGAMRSTQADTCSCILCECCQGISCCRGGPGASCDGTPHLVHLPRGPSRLSVQRQIPPGSN